MVTGASRGIGAAIALRLSSAGAAVAAVARTVEESSRIPGSLRETVGAIEAAGGKAVAVAADLAAAADRVRAVERTREALGAVDILVNNAAAAFYMPFESFSEKRFRLAFEINVRAPFETTQLLLPAMRERGHGCVVNISSYSALPPQGPPFSDFDVGGGALVYGMTKAALDRFSAGLAAETHADGIRVNSLSPVAAVLTPGVEALGVLPEEYRKTAEPVETMAEAVLALAASDDPTLTGRILYSKALLEELSRPVRTLDGSALL